ncbi:MAG: 16S rRNA (adenine(1518)-N(6)/adenine(1519)-N(6))-dimethyltransferase RsmA [Microthrixaceae bacterium]
MLGAAEVRELLDRAGLSAKRSLGQNFVADPNTVRRIARLAGVVPGVRVVEVGPGLGSLTLALLDAGAEEVVAVEKDHALASLLPHVLAAHDPERAGRVRLVEADALGVSWTDLLGPGPWVLVANLPYNVAVPVLLRVLATAPEVDHLVVMVQKEVADRLVATPGGRAIGVPTVKVAWYGTARTVAVVGPEVFVPRPRVDSAVVEVRRREPPRSGDPAPVFALVERAYRQRRKMLRATLGGVVDPAAFAAAGVEPTARPEELGVDDWVALAGAAGGGS